MIRKHRQKREDGVYRYFSERTDYKNGEHSGSEGVSHGYYVNDVVIITRLRVNYSDKGYVTKEGQLASSGNDVYSARDNVKTEKAR